MDMLTLPSQPLCHLRNHDCKDDGFPANVTFQDLDDSLDDNMAASLYNHSSGSEDKDNRAELTNDTRRSSYFDDFFDIDQQSMRCVT